MSTSNSSLTLPPPGSTLTSPVGDTSGDFELQTTQEHPPGHKDVTVNTAAVPAKPGTSINGT